MSYFCLLFVILNQAEYCDFNIQLYLLRGSWVLWGDTRSRVYKFPSKITPASTTSKSTSEINPAATTTNETTPASATSSKSTVTTKSKDLHHNLDLDDNPPLKTGIILTKLLKLVAVLVTFTLKVCLFLNMINKFLENCKLRMTIANLYNKNTKLEKTNIDISKKLKSLKDDFSTLMEINDAFGTKNEELKRKLRASKIDNIESKHLFKKAKGKRIIVQISDDDDKDEDVDDDLMDAKLNATDKLPEKPNKKGAKVY
ncbi:hypothetical protein C1646_776010 [Rhizophagus diaphanus]|nr:hypothetical protein C1646_776010 [Rhizophagus diaphanus] [Rhizophagus sp. MUCL 43196]